MFPELLEQARRVHADFHPHPDLHPSRGRGSVGSPVKGEGEIEVALAVEHDPVLGEVGVPAAKRRPQHESALYWCEQMRLAETVERKRECHDNMVRAVLAM